ncbi:MAG: thermonuclease family protein [Planctomycetes bacterium]|nr:thermonuclease family protein [Planctomycetota bacterium]
MIRFKRQPVRVRPDTALAIVFSFIGPVLALALQTDLIVGTASGKVYHTHPDCTSLKKIAPENRVSFTSVSMAEREGRRLCKTCEKLHARDGDRPGATKQSENKPASTQPDVANTSDGTIVSARVVKALPGGTLVLDNGDKAALHGVGVPVERQEMARECLKALSEQAPIGTVTAISRDESPVRDSLGRLCVHVVLASDGSDLGASLIREGLAWADPSTRPLRGSQYEKCEMEAWEKGKGIWKRLDGSAGQSDVLVGRFAPYFHPVNCRHEVHLTEPTRITLNEAKARRLKPCDRYQMPRLPSDATVSKSTLEKGTNEEKE